MLGNDISSNKSISGSQNHEVKALLEDEFNNSKSSISKSSEKTPINENDIFKKIGEILCVKKRKKALFFLTKNREIIPNLAELLINTPGVVAAFLFEIVSSYDSIFDNKTTKDQLCNCFNVLSLFQIIASNKEAKKKFVECKITYFIQI